MAATPIEEVHQATSLCSVSLSSFFSLSPAHQATLATIRSERLWHGVWKCTVVVCKEITKGINSVTSPSVEKMCINENK